MFRTWSLAIAASAALIIATPGARAACDSAAATDTMTVEQRIEQAQFLATQLRTTADSLQMLARSPLTVSFQSVAATLDRAQGLADRVGVELCALHCASESATAVQRVTIANMSEQLRAVSSNTGEAIHQFNARRTMADLLSPQFQESVRLMYEGSKALRSATAPSAATVAD